jgi:tetratricopeptide (TPR) repeat protein
MGARWLESAMSSAFRLPLSIHDWVFNSSGYVWGLIVLFCFNLAVPVRGQDAAQELFKQAQEAKARGDLPEAEAKYRKLVGQNPDMSPAYQNLGIVYLSEHKYLDAAQVLEKAVKLAPREPGGWFIRGLAYYELYEPQKAISDFQSALLLNPADKNAQLYLGKTQIQMRDYEGAARTLEKLSKTSPNDAVVLYNLGVAHMKLMLEYVNRLTAVSPQSYLLLLLLAQDAETRGDTDAAARFYQQALHANSMAAGVHYALGSIYANSGKYDDAAKEFQEELKLNPNDPLALWKLGEITLRTDPRSACDYLERALTLDPDLPQPRLAYGRALVRLGEPEKAIQQFEQVERLAPEEDSVHYHLAAAYRRLGRSQEAAAEMAKFQQLAKKKSAITEAAARREIEMTRDLQDEPPADFDPSRNPVHH